MPAVPELLRRGWEPRKMPSETWPFYWQRRQLEVCGEVLRQEMVQRRVAQEQGARLIRPQDGAHRDLLGHSQPRRRRKRKRR